MSRFKYLFVAGLLIQLLTFCIPCDSSCNLAIAPLLLGTLAAAGGAAMNSIANSQNKSNAQYSMNLQKDLLNYQWEKFDSPKAQLDSYAAAGINPSVALGQGAMRGASPSANAPQVAQVTQSATDTANNILALSEAKKAGSETAGIELNNEILKGSLADRIKEVALNNKWKQEDISRIENVIGNIQGQNSKLQVEIDNLRKEGKTLDFENENWKTKFNAEMRKYADEHNINTQEFKQMQEQAPYILGKLKSEDKILNLESEIQGSYAETNAKLGVVGKVIELLVKMLK